jgi:hypothetical protein
MLHAPGIRVRFGIKIYPTVGETAGEFDVYGLADPPEVMLL